MSAQPMQEEEYERRSIFSRARAFFFGNEELDDLEEDQQETVHEAPQSRRHQFKVQNIRHERINVLRNATEYDDAKAAADGLKCGQQQIVNLERATPEKMARIVDFLNGACYALDGTVHQIGNRVVMFVPANVSVEEIGGSSQSSESSPRRSAFSE